MKKIGLIGFSTGVSTKQYARLIEDLFEQFTMGELDPEILRSKVSFDEFENLRKRGRGDVLIQPFIEVIQKELEGAEIGVIASVFVHKYAQALMDATGINILHIGDVLGAHLKLQNLGTVLLLGTKETMESDFISAVLLNKYGIETIIPEEADRAYLDHVIYEELCHNIVREESKNNMINIIRKGKDRGAVAVIQGSTELPMLFAEKDLPEWASMPVVNAMELHAVAAVRKSLEFD